MNARFSYLYRDGDNYKNPGHAVFSNPDGLDVAAAEKRLRAAFDDEDFVPHENLCLGLEHAQAILDQMPTFSRHGIRVVQGAIHFFGCPEEARFRLWGNRAERKRQKARLKTAHRAYARETLTRNAHQLRQALGLPQPNASRQPQTDLRHVIHVAVTSTDARTPGSP